jgi:hypothetical protein
MTLSSPAPQAVEVEAVVAAVHRVAPLSLTAVPRRAAVAVVRVVLPAWQVLLALLALQAKARVFPTAVRMAATAVRARTTDALS